MAEYAAGDCIRTTLTDGSELDEFVWCIIPKGDKAAYPFEDHGLLRTVYISPRTGQWVKGWRWPDDSGVRRCEEADHLVGKWFAHCLLHGSAPLEGVELC